MLTAVVLLTIGSIKAKRQAEDRAKFRTLAIWFSIALLLYPVVRPLAVFAAAEPAGVSGLLAPLPYSRQTTNFPTPLLYATTTTCPASGAETGRPSRSK